MTLLQAVLLGVVEGITEFLPISSTAHLVLSEKFLGIPTTEVVKTFDIVIQLGAIAAVMTLFWKECTRKDMVKLSCIGFIPTAIIGWIGHDAVKALLDQTIIIATSLFVGGVTMIAVELFIQHRTIKKITPLTAGIIGIIQSLAMIPGVSRSAATIVGGLLLGIDRRSIVAFSFLLAIPTMLGATVLDLIHVEHILTKHEIVMMGTGFISAYLTAIIALRWLLRYIEKHSFISFGVYRIILAMIVAVTLL